MAQDSDLRRALEQSLLKVAQLKAELAGQGEGNSEPIAIVGMGCRFPGGAVDLETYWQLLKEGRDGVRDTSSRWGASVATQPEVRWAGLLESIDGFDPLFFGIAAREAISLDPQQRLLLEVAWEALEDAGIAPTKIKGRSAGVFVGIGPLDYFTHHVVPLPPSTLDLYSATGNTAYMASGRISYTLGLAGPSLTVDTACSSSLVALHLACHSLRAHESSLCLVGGVNLLVDAHSTHVLAATQALSPDGKCRTFDASANGFVRGEGCGVLVLKRLSDAQRDRDRIWALIRGSAVNQDGRSTGLTAPNVLAQQAVLREALRHAGVSPSEVDYVEAHGTGTPLGDPIELEALKEVLGRPRENGSKCLVGSVKTNIGHLEPAAGVAGVIKTVLALHHGFIPGQLHFDTLNPRVVLADTAIQIAATGRPWPAASRPRRAGVSSFGLSGTNAHAILEQAPGSEEEEPVSPCCHVLPLSARTDRALEQLVERYIEHLERHPEQELAQVCRTAGVGRNAFEERLAVVGRTREELMSRLGAWRKDRLAPGVVSRKAFSQRGHLVFVFPGQGGQWVQMGRELYETEPVFRACIDACGVAIARWVDWNLVDVLKGIGPLASLEEVDVVQPAVFAMQVGLAALWRSWGIEPRAVVGHSLGEVAAAHVAGALTLADASRIICERSRLVKRASGQGGMAMVELSEAEAASALAQEAGRVSVAAVNGPRSAILSGERAALERVVSALKKRGVFSRWIKVDYASHSAQMDPLQAELLRLLDGIRPEAPKIPLYSTVTGQKGHADFGAGYWARNLREPVRFWAAVRALCEDGHDTFVELSPHPVLLQGMEEGLASEECVTVPSLKREEGAQEKMREALATLYASGYPVDWSRLYPSGVPVQVPTYPFQREPYWLATSPLRQRARGAHPLLGDRLDLAVEGTSIWESDLDPLALPYLKDHQVESTVVYPASGYVEMALQVARETNASGCLGVDGLRVSEALILGEAPRRAQVVATREADALSLAVHSQEATSWICHARARVPLALAESFGGETLQAARSRCPRALPAEDFYRALASRGLSFGPSFQRVRGAWIGDGEAVTELVPPEAARGDSPYVVHPALLDGALQALAPLCPPEVALALPVGLERLRAHPSRIGSTRWSHARLRRQPKGDALVGDFRLFDEAGELVGEIQGLELKALVRSKRAEPLLHVAWRRSPLPSPPPSSQPGRWLLLSDEGGLGRALEAKLRGRGAETVVVPLHELSGDRLQQIRRRTQDGSWAGVVHLGPSDQPRGEDTSMDAVEAMLERDVASILGATQGLAAESSGHSGRLFLVTRAAQPVDGDEPLSMTGAMIVGLGRTLSNEHPELRCTRIDLPPAGPVASFADELLQELLSGTDESEVAYRKTGRWVGRLARAEQARRSEPQVDRFSRADATYLVAGGLGALGLAAAEWLVKRGARHLVLMGRSEPQTDAQRQALKRLEALGARVLTVAADVSKRADVEAVLVRIRTQMPPLRGIIHAAGVLEDAMMVNQTVERFRRVAAPKVAGAWNLHVLTRGQPLDFFVLYSSGASLLGGVGQGNYAAANAFLDALAHHRRAQGLEALSINWAPFSGVGLAAARENRGARIEAQGVRNLSVKEGMEILETLLGSPTPQVGVVPLDLSVLLKSLPALARSPLWSELTRALPSQAPGTEPIREVLASLPAAEREAALERYVREQAAAVLRIPAARIDPTAAFTTLGMDSLMGFELRNRLEAAVSVKLPATLVWTHRTSRALTAHLLAGPLATLTGAPSPQLPGVLPSSSAPLSPAQARLWFIEQLEPGTPLYNVPLAWRVRGRLDSLKLEEALNQVIRRHQALRLTFEEKDGRAVQRVAEEARLRLRVEHVTAGGLKEREKHAQLEMERAAREPLDLAKAPLLRATVWALGDGDWILFLLTHHLASDGWSVQILADDLFRAYHRLTEGKEPAWDGLAAQYLDYVAWQNQQLATPELQAQLEHWKSRLAGSSGVLNLPTDKPRPAIQRHRGEFFPFSYSGQLGRQVEKLAQAEGVSPFMVLLSAWSVLLARYADQSDLVIGTPIASRRRPGTERLMGLFINMLPLRVELDPTDTLRSLLQRVQRTCLEAYANQDLPFEQLIEALQPPRDLSREPVFQVMLAFQNYPYSETARGDWSISPLLLDSGTSKFDLSLYMWTTRDDEWGGAIEYCTDLFERATIERMLGHLRRTLELAVAEPSHPLQDFDLVSRREKELLLGEWNRTQAEYPRDRCVHQLFEAQASRSPTAIALEHAGQTLTFGELNDRADALGRRLLALGAGTDAPIGVCVERSPDMLVALLGVLKARAAYVPMDPSYPAGRLSYMLKDSGAKLVITDPNLPETLEVPPAVQVVRLSNQGAASKAAVPMAGPGTDPESLAYVIYTSGSTGRPKGVQVTHRSVVNLLESMRKIIDLGPSDTWLSVTPISFDIAALELFLPLMVGARISLADRSTAMDPNLLANLIDRSGATVMQATPTTWRMLVESGWKAPRAMKTLCGGEALSAELGQALRARVGTLWNVYGPTETTIWSSACRVEPDQPITLGRPLANTQMRVLDRALRLQPIGVPGDLYIGGDGLARGYWNRPDLTAERFIKDPYSPVPGARLYKTGDVARYRATGEIEFLGRSDFQVKVRGHRIELGEIESALRRCPGVRDAAVTVWTPASGEATLVAYVEGKADEIGDVDRVRGILRDQLPDYMLPNKMAVLEGFPVTPNGKLDRKALPPPPGDERTKPPGVPPRDPLELHLVGLWESTLNVRPVGILDDFFELGGHSMLAVRLMNQIHAQLGVMLPINALFQSRTVEQLALRIRKARQQNQKESPFSPLVVLRSGAQRKGVFFVHPLGGTVMFYSKLAREISSDIPVYGFELVRPGPVPDRIEAMAAEYIEHMRRAQPEGPYHLAGYSVGGVIAFEMARQLEAAKLPVGLVGLLGTYVPEMFRRHFQQEQGRAASPAARLAAIFLSVFKDHPKERDYLSAQTDSEMQIAVVQKLATAAGIFPADFEVSQVHRIALAMDAIARASLEYYPGSYSGPVTLFWPDGDGHNDPVQSRDWSKLVGSLAVEWVTGTHERMIDPPHAANLAKVLDRCVLERE